MVLEAVLEELQVVPEAVVCLPGEDRCQSLMGNI